MSFRSIGGCISKLGRELLGGGVVNLPRGSSQLYCVTLNHCITSTVEPTGAGGCIYPRVVKWYIVTTNEGKLLCCDIVM